MDCVLNKSVWMHVSLPLISVHTFTCLQLVKFRLQSGQPAAYFASQMLATSSYRIWSCFTYVINLKSTCDPSTSVYLRSFNGNGQTVGNCVSKSTGSVVPGSDLSGTTSLFFSVQFNLTRFSLDTQV